MRLMLKNGFFIVCDIWKKIGKPQYKMKDISKYYFNSEITLRYVYIFLIIESKRNMKNEWREKNYNGSLVSEINNHILEIHS